MSNTIEGTMLPVLEIDPNPNGHLGRIVGMACASGEFTLLPEFPTVFADLKFVSETCFLTYRTDDGPSPPSLPESFKHPGDITLSKAGFPEEGFLVANAFLENAVCRIMSRKPDLLCGSMQLWHVQITGTHNLVREFWARLRPYESEVLSMQLMERIFEFHHEAIRRAIHGLSGKMNTTLTSRRKM